MINNETTTFTIELYSNETEQPGIYITDDIEIDCNKTDAQLICTPTEVNMPLNMEYTIYYKDLCENLVDTGITVTNQRQEVNVDDNKAVYVTISKILFSLLVVLII